MHLASSTPVPGVVGPPTHWPPRRRYLDFALKLAPRMQQVYTNGRPHATPHLEIPLLPRTITIPPSPAPESTVPAGSSNPLVPIRLLVRLLRSLLTLSRIPILLQAPPSPSRSSRRTVSPSPSALSSSTTTTPPPNASSRARHNPKPPKSSRPTTPQTPPKCTPPHLKSFLEKTLNARETTHSAPRIALTLAPESGRSQALPPRNASLG